MDDFDFFCDEQFGGFESDMDIFEENCLREEMWLDDQDNFADDPRGGWVDPRSERDDEQDLIDEDSLEFPW